MKYIFPAAPEEALLKTLHPDIMHSLPQYPPINQTNINKITHAVWKDFLQADILSINQNHNYLADFVSAIHFCHDTGRR